MPPLDEVAGVLAVVSGEIRVNPLFRTLPAVGAGTRKLRELAEHCVELRTIQSKRLGRSLKAALKGKAISETPSSKRWSMAMRLLNFSLLFSL